MTGVQTCALPISHSGRSAGTHSLSPLLTHHHGLLTVSSTHHTSSHHRLMTVPAHHGLLTIPLLRVPLLPISSLVMIPSLLVSTTHTLLLLLLSCTFDLVK